MHENATSEGEGETLLQHLRDDVRATSTLGTYYGAQLARGVHTRADPLS